MGEVYLAEDSRLHRKVALKILPPEMAANQDRMRRFKQEATAAAALNHPNIAHIYEIGESDGTNFIAMEFVEGVELDPTYWYAHDFLGRAYEQKGRLPEAIAEFQRAVELEKDNAENWANLGHAYALSGKRAEAQRIIDHLKEVSAHSYVAPYNFAVIYAGLGDKDQAFDWLDRAYTDRSGFLAFYFNTDARMDNLRYDPRFGELMRRVGLPQ